MKDTDDRNIVVGSGAGRLIGDQLCLGNFVNVITCSLKLKVELQKCKIDLYCY